MKIVNIMGSVRKWLGIIIPILLFFVLTGSLFNNLKRTKETNKIIQNTKDKLQNSQNENKELEKQLQFVQSQEFLEEQFRNKLGLAKEGEIVLVLPDEEILRKLAPYMPEEADPEPLPNWKKWIELFM